MKSSQKHTPRTFGSDNAASAVRYDASLLTDQDLHLFNEGRHDRLYQKLGAHLVQANGAEGTHFAVWAPNAKQVCVMGDFNGWDKSSHALQPRAHCGIRAGISAGSGAGIWEGFIPGVGPGELYKYYVVSRHGDYRVDKTDPFAFFLENPPRTASVVCNLEYSWGDAAWMQSRHQRNSLRSPIAIYEVHLGSWMRVPEQNNRWLSYRELAPKLTDYVRRMGFTHVEFLPVMEHPFYGSWGYQTTGYFAPTSRYGAPQDLMYLIDSLHQNGIGVILDWVPSHFPGDEHGLAYFDGTHLYEHADPRKGFHPDWGSYIFNYEQHESRSFLLSSASFWLDTYHADGLRVDAVSSMLYLDYSRPEGEWVPNRYGGRENLEAAQFLRELNQHAYKNYPDIQTVAEESTSWPMVTRPAHLGGLGFGMKWDMGWMHDTREYLSQDHGHRKDYHDKLTFRMTYAFTESFLLPLSHDEVVYGKSSLLGKMAGDDWQKFANLRLLLGYMYSQPGKKLLFMGGEFGQWREWNHEKGLDWHLLQYAPHDGLQKWVEDLNRLYRSEPALYELDNEPAGFEWIDCDDSDQSVLTFLRRGHSSDDVLVVACNFTPIHRTNYRLGVPRGGFWRELLNSDAQHYGGRGSGNLGGVEAGPASVHGRPYALSITLPPLAIAFFKNGA